MTTLAQKTKEYAAVLRQLLPYGGYDTAPTTVIAADVQGHSKALAQAEINAARVLKSIEQIPAELVGEYERDYGLPLKCSVPSALTVQQRTDLLNEVMSEQNTINRAYLEALLARFGVVLLDVKTYRPMPCTAPCTSPVNTNRLRFKVTLKLQSPVLADINCIIENYLPAYLRVDVLEG